MPSAITCARSSFRHSPNGCAPAAIGFTSNRFDLRWGVETMNDAQVEAREAAILKACLADIDRSRPFLVAPLGDRYGWTPPAAHMIPTVEGRSVTELEISYGVLRSPEQQRRWFFYLRDPQGLHQWMFDHAKRIAGAARASAFLALIAFSRGGWRPSDFAALMPAVTGEPWDDLRFATLGLV
jgi:hypothetical protein